eukprot:GHRQ01031372.1.p1 GENE.GHRQ01031372.1~~GHRQ01031372.1.p1  ORF type:complete len:229 (+),score=102.64 GHRQ01031372.1:91-687(+)
MAAVVAAMAAQPAGILQQQGDETALPLTQQHPPPPPPPPALPKTLPTSFSTVSSATAPESYPAPAAAAATKAAGDSSSASVSYQDGPLMLFVDTSAFLSMLGCAGSVASGTALTLKLLQALAGSGRFGRGLPSEQQTFIVLADTVLKQLDSCKAAEAGVGGPVRRWAETQQHWQAGSGGCYAQRCHAERGCFAETASH